MRSFPKITSKSSGCSSLLECALCSYNKIGSFFEILLFDHIFGTWIYLQILSFLRPLPLRLRRLSLLQLFLFNEINGIKEEDTHWSSSIFTCFESCSSCCFGKTCFLRGSSCCTTSCSKTFSLSVFESLAHAEFTAKKTGGDLIVIQYNWWQEKQWTCSHLQIKTYATLPNALL